MNLMNLRTRSILKSHLFLKNLKNQTNLKIR
jgi:hypothetical protein